MKGWDTSSVNRQRALAFMCILRLMGFSGTILREASGALNLWEMSMDHVEFLCVTRGLWQGEVFSARLLAVDPISSGSVCLLFLPRET